MTNWEINKKKTGSLLRKGSLMSMFARRAIHNGTMINADECKIISDVLDKAKAVEDKLHQSDIVEFNAHEKQVGVRSGDGSFGSFFSVTKHPSKTNKHITLSHKTGSNGHNGRRGTIATVRTLKREHQAVRIPPPSPIQTTSRPSKAEKRRGSKNMNNVYNKSKSADYYTSYNKTDAGDNLSKPASKNLKFVSKGRSYYNKTTVGEKLSKPASKDLHFANKGRSYSLSSISIPMRRKSSGRMRRYGIIGHLDSETIENERYTHLSKPTSSLTVDGKHDHDEKHVVFEAISTPTISRPRPKSLQLPRTRSKYRHQLDIQSEVTASVKQMNLWKHEKASPISVLSSSCSRRKSHHNTAKKYANLYSNTNNNNESIPKPSSSLIAMPQIVVENDTPKTDDSPALTSVRRGSSNSNCDIVISGRVKRPSSFPRRSSASNSYKNATNGRKPIRNNHFNNDINSMFTPSSVLPEESNDNNNDNNNMDHGSSVSEINNRHSFPMQKHKLPPIF